MICEHKRIKSVNCEYFCIDCGENIPAEFVPGLNVKKPAENQPADESKGKSTGRKRNVKKAE